LISNKKEPHEIIITLVMLKSSVSASTFVGAPEGSDEGAPEGAADGSDEGADEGAPEGSDEGALEAAGVYP